MKLIGADGTPPPLLYGAEPHSVPAIRLNLIAGQMIQGAASRAVIKRCERENFAFPMGPVRGRPQNHLTFFDLRAARDPLVSF